MRTIRFWSTARLEPERESAEADALALLEAVQIKRCELLQGSVILCRSLLLFERGLRWAICCRRSMFSTA
jgi:hypothetical protein